MSVNRTPNLPAHDEELLAAVAADGRASLVELAAAVGLTTGRASRHLDALLLNRIVHIDVEIAPAALGFHARANLWLQVHPSGTMRVGRSLARLPEVGFVAAMSGRNNLHAVVHCRELDELFEFTSDRVGGLQGVQSAEVRLIHAQVKQAGTLMVDRRLEETPSRRRR